MKVCIQNLGKYNEGELVFKWVSLPISEGDFEKVKKDIGIDGKAYEEWFLGDWDIELEKFGVSEYCDVMALSEVVDKFDNLEKREQDIVEYLLNEGYYSDIQEAINVVDDVDYYEGMSLEELAIQFSEEGVFSSEFLESYIDWKRVARDLSYDYTETDKGVFRH